MKTTAPADLHRWSEELARNPASLAFLPLARAYRRSGRRDLARQLCLRGLENHPAHVEAHALLALLYFEAGDREKAAAEWATVLRLKPGNFEALRGMGFRCLEQGDITQAKQHLERAALIRPEDATVQEALRHIGQREVSSSRPSPVQPERRPPSPQTGQPAGPQPEGRHASPLPARAAPARPAMPSDPDRLFEELAASGPLLGVMLLDRRGLVLAGSLPATRTGAAEEVGAILGGAIDEAARTVTHLELGSWQGLQLECAGAVVNVAPVGRDALVMVAARRGAPGGWIARALAHAAAIAGPFLGLGVRS